jgi:hypothetical protein
MASMAQRGGAARRFWVVSVVLALGGLLSASCSSPQSGGSPGARCTQDGDCNAALACKFGSCHSWCRTSALDCPTGQRCVDADGSKVCLLTSEAPCTQASDCQTPLVCMSDGQCRNACTSVSDCVTGQVCVQRVCAEPSEVTAGTLVGAGTIPDPTGTGGTSGGGGGLGGGGGKIGTGASANSGGSGGRIGVGGSAGSAGSGGSAGSAGSGGSAGSAGSAGSGGKGGTGGVGGAGGRIGFGGSAGFGAIGGSAGSAGSGGGGPTGPVVPGWYCGQAGEACACIPTSAGASPANTCTLPQAGCCFTFTSQGSRNCQCQSTAAIACTDWLSAIAGTRVPACPPPG